MDVEQTTKCVSEGNGLGANKCENELERLARLLVESRSALWGNFRRKRPGDRVEGELLRTIEEIRDATGVSPERVTSWIGLDPELLQLWAGRSGKRRERLERDRRYRERLTTLFGKNSFRILYLTLSLLAVVVCYLYVDRPVLAYMHGVGPGWIRFFFVKWTDAGESVLYLLLGSLAYLLVRRRDRVQGRRILFFLYSILASGLVVNLIKPLAGRSRPELWLNFGIYGFHPFYYHLFQTDSNLMLSFPSGHSSTAFAVGLSLSLLMPRYRWLFFLYAFLTAASRIVVMRHYPADVIAGAAIAFFTTIVLYTRYYAREGVDG